MTPAIQLLLRNLGRRDVVSDDEAAMLAALTQRRVDYPKGAEMIAEQSRPDASCLLQAGLAARAVSRANGTRQLTALHVAGDFVDLHGMLLKEMDHSVVAMSPCTVVFVPHRELRVLTETAPHLTRLLWMSTTIDAAIQRRMTALIGRHTPVERLGHLLCEIYLRLEAVGEAAEGTFPFPITQTELADLLGLSVVHTNRTVQDLRATKLVTWDHHTITVADFPRLMKMVGFDDNYLNLRVEPR